MIRRNARLRKEYLYRKSLEGKDKAAYERKRKIRQARVCCAVCLRCVHAVLCVREWRRAHASSSTHINHPPPPKPNPTATPLQTLKKQALEQGKPIPTELRADAHALRNEAELEDDRTGAAPRTHEDDEYARAGERDPKVLITTSRDPSSRLTAFAKEVRLVVPNAQRLNRGGMLLSELVEAARTHDFSDVIILHEHRGEPDGLVVCHLPYGPTAYFGLSNAVLRHDIGAKKTVGTVSEAYPHLIFDGFASPLGARVASILKHLFPVPKDDSKRVVTFANRDDYISFRHHTYTAPAGPKSVELTECGPRFELRPYQIRLGTVDQPHAETEWALRAYTRSAKKAKLGGGGEGGDGGGGGGGDGK
jgi:U3 small nucleolar ribonucleoprotein protein IMP4